MKPDVAFPGHRVLAYTPAALGVVVVTFERIDWPRFWRRRCEQVSFRKVGSASWVWADSGVPLELAPAHVWRGLMEAAELCSS